MRPVLFSIVLGGLVLAATQMALAQDHTCSVAPTRLCHSAWVVPLRHRRLHPLAHRRLARYGRPYHIPRFSQAEAEAEVHTVYPYRTGVYAPWPDFYGTPYYPPY